MGKERENEIEKGERGSIYQKNDDSTTYNFFEQKNFDYYNKLLVSDLVINMLSHHLFFFLILYLCCCLHLNAG